MGFVSNLLGLDEPSEQEPQAPKAASAQQPRPAQTSPTSGAAPAAPAGGDAQAVERYRYLLRTAPPDALEKAHAEAFAQLSSEQRRQVLEQMAQNVPAAERPSSDDPQSLARAATRAEVRQPGFMERTFGGPMGAGGGMGMGSMLLSSIAGSFIGSSIAHSLFGGGSMFGQEESMHGLQDSSEAQASDETSHAEDETGDDVSDDVGDEVDNDVGGDGGDFGDFGDMGDGIDV